MKMSPKKWTVAVITIAAVLLIGWDIVVALNNERGDTISEIVLATSYSWSIIPASLGAIMGHFFWPRNSEKNIEVLVSCGVLFLTKDLIAWLWETADTPAEQFILYTMWFPLVPFIIGVVVGHFWWPQKKK